MYESLIAALRNVSEYDSGYAKLMYDAADAIEAQDRHILTIQHEMMAEAECHIADVKRLNKQIEKLQADMRPVVRGKWIWRGFNIKCPFCKFEPQFDSTEPLYNYCPNCGADMRKQPKEE